MSSKPQLGWRKDNADEVLYTPMFRLGYELKIHLAKHGKVTEEWNCFQNQLYQQNGFIGHEPGSIESIKLQWRNRIETYKRKFGHEDGVQGNLSGEAGDLPEPDCIIKKILKEQQDEDERKKAIEADKAAVNQTESSVLLNVLSEKSKKKRKSIDNNGEFVESTPKINRDNGNNNMSNLSTNSTKSSNSNNSSNSNQINSFNELTNAVNSFSKNFVGFNNNDNNHNSNNNNNGANDLVEENVERDLIKHIQDVESNIAQSKIDELDKESIISNIQVYLNIYCTRGEKFNPKFIKDQFKELGLSLLSVHSLYMIFERARKELLIK